MIDDVINTINNSIDTRSKELCKCGDPILYGIASPILVRSEYEGEDQVVFPAIIDNEGECKYIFADDDYSFGVYHRIISRNYSKVKGYGRTDMDVSIDEIILICWGFRNQLNISAFNFEKQIIIPCLPKEAAIIQSNFDQFSVFNGEFKNVVYNLVPELFLFSVKYKVQYTFDRGCVEINESNKCQ